MTKANNSRDFDSQRHDLFFNIGFQEEHTWIVRDVSALSLASSNPGM